MTPEFNRWWDADELDKTNPYPEDTPVWWAWEGWKAGKGVSVDCSTCANRGRIDGLSQETHCDHCMWQERWRTDHYRRAEQKCPACGGNDSDMPHSAKSTGDARHEQE